jgi:tRNA-dihydrouridine synthase B
MGAPRSSRTPAGPDWDLVAQVAGDLDIPVLGSGDCVEPDEILARLRLGVSGVLVGRGVLRNPWILSQAAALAAGQEPAPVTLQQRGEFLRAYVRLLLAERVAEADGFRHRAPGQVDEGPRLAPARGRERWVINKVRALCAWYSKGLEGGSTLRSRVNTADSLAQLDEMIDEFFAAPTVVTAG